MIEDKRPEEFRDIVSVCEATSFEQFLLWQKYHKLLPWEQILTGRMYKAGEIRSGKKRFPITVCLAFAKIRGKRICFYEAVSMVVHHDTVEKSIQKYLCPPDGRIQKADGFHGVLADIGESLSSYRHPLRGDIDNLTQVTASILEQNPAAKAPTRHLLWAYEKQRELISEIEQLRNGTTL
jgi:hypothetical protein